MTSSLFVLTALLAALSSQAPQIEAENGTEYRKILRETARGWNTWDTRSVLTYVLLPETFAVRMSVRDNEGEEAKDLRIGNNRQDAAILHPGDHSYNGAYTDITLSWHDITIRIQTASRGDDLVILATPLTGNGKLVIRPQLCWNFGLRYSDAWFEEDGFHFTSQGGEKDIRFRVCSQHRIDGDALVCSLESPIVISSAGNMTESGARNFIETRATEEFSEEKRRFGSRYDTYRAVRNILAWDTIFDPSEQKIFTTVSRNWNVERAAVEELGGYALFEWDNYFAAMMLSQGSRELAYLNAIENTLSVDDCGFVPNVRSDHGLRSYDRSEPPVGSLAVWTIYSKYREKWFLKMLFDRLMEWNRWWHLSRSCDGLLCYGSNSYPHIICRENEYRCGNLAAAILESGMDNSPMYDNASYDSNTGLLSIQDVGLTSLYVADCRYLARIAREIGRDQEAGELDDRADFYAVNSRRFWCPEDEMYYNIDAKSGKFVKRCSPTSFYPLLTGMADEKSAEKLVRRHLANPDEFWGEWVIPSTPHNDPAFADNSYWRGRIWAPLNFLVYCGLSNYESLRDIRTELAEKSKALLMNGWNRDGYIFENYSAVDGRGDDVGNSDKFYHWGALLGYISLLESENF